MTSSPQGADVHVLIDAIASVMMLEEKELCKTGELAIAIMRETASLIMGDVYKVRLLYIYDMQRYCQDLIMACPRRGSGRDAYMKWKVNDDGTSVM